MNVMKRWLLIMTLVIVLSGCQVLDQPAISRHLVTFVDHDGAVIHETWVKDGEDAVLPEPPVLEGHVFVGWDGDHTVVTESRWITACFEIVIYTITFETGGIAELPDLEISYMSTLPTLDVHVPEGLIFAGWYLNPDLTLPFDDGGITGNLVLYGKFIVSEHPLTLWIDGILHEDFGLVPYDTVLVLPEPEMDGMVFSGWYEDPDGSTLFTSESMPAHPLVLHGLFEPVPRAFVTVDGDRLVLDGETFRFVSFNVPNLHVLEDPYWHRVHPWEQEDAIRSVSWMGGRVIRTYTLSIIGGIRPSEGGNTLAHIMGIGQYHEPLFVDLDHAIALAGMHDVRLIIPFIDEWDWFGGVAHFAALYGKTRQAFYTDPVVKEGFKDLINHVLNRVNTVNGIVYKDDPAILAWELGNELRSAPDAWIAEMAAHVKSIDGNHLLLSGRDQVTQADLDNPDIDIINVHYYANYGSGLFADRARSDRLATEGIKPLLIGEYGLVDFAQMEAMVQEMVSNGTSGSLIWSLRFRSHDGGFYYHDDPPSRSYHYPGFPLNDDYHERQVIDMITTYAHLVRGMPVEPPPLPEGSHLFDIHEGEISWRGSTGSYVFVIERREINGSWEVIADNVFDALPSGPFHIDTTGVVGITYQYRIRSSNLSGFSPYSNIVTHVYTRESDPVNLALNKPVTASSTENDQGVIHHAWHVTDGNLLTRWSSIYEDDQWITIDLIETFMIGKIVLTWETAHARRFGILTSIDGLEWQLVHETFAGQGGRETIVLDASMARYVRIDLHERATSWGFSLYEIEVYANE